MLDHLRRLARFLYEIPVIGRLVQWAIVLLRLPALQHRQLELTQRQIEQAQRQAELATQQTRAQETAGRENSALQMGIDEMARLAEQLSQRLAAIEAQLALINAPAEENLVISVPVALRRSARDIAQLRAQIEQMQHTVMDGSERKPA